MQRTPISSDELNKHLSGARQSLRRFEVHGVYNVRDEFEQVARWLEGERPSSEERKRPWLERVQKWTTAGVTVQRIRVHDDNPTDYQRWLRWAGASNIAAGETIAYLTQSEAERIHLFPDAREVDGWIIDGKRAIVFNFDSEDRITSQDLIAEPQDVALINSWWDLAVTHAQIDRAATAA